MNHEDERVVNTNSEPLGMNSTGMEILCMCLIQLLLCNSDYKY